MAKTYTQQEVLAEIEKEIGKYGVRPLARQKGISASQLSDTRTGRVPISQAIAKVFGFERLEAEITFRKAS